MKITFIGVGTAVMGVQSCILVEGEETRIVVDVGAGSSVRLNYRDLDAILITHNHLDHIGDILPILKARWLSGCDYIDIYGVRGTRSFMESLIEAYAYLRNKLKFKIHEGLSEFRIGEFRIDVIPTYHSIESQAYLISDGEKSVLISGDTRAFKELMEIECDVLIHEMSLPFGYSSTDHTTPENFAENLKFCNAKTVYLTHIYPQTLEVLDDIMRYLRGVRRDIEFKVAREMESFNI